MFPLHMAMQGLYSSTPYFFSFFFFFLKIESYPIAQSAFKCEFFSVTTPKSLEVQYELRLAHADSVLALCLPERTPGPG